MSQERRDRQARAIADQAAAYLRSRETLRPAAVAIAVRSALGGRVDHPASSLAVLQSLGAVGTWSNRGTFSNVRGRP